MKSIGTKQDDRTPEERAATQGFIVATDKALSGWGQAPGRSIVVCPYISDEDKQAVLNRFNLRDEFRFVRDVGADWRPRMRRGDHVHIYDTTTSFRYAL